MASLKEAFLGTEKQNREAQEMLDRQAKSGSKLAKLLGGKDGKDEGFEPRKYLDQDGYRTPTDAVRGGSSAPGSEADVRSLNMGIKSKAPKSEDYKKYDEERGVSKDMKKGGKVSSASKRADGIAQRGKTKGKYL